MSQEYSPSGSRACRYFHLSDAHNLDRAGAQVEAEGILRERYPCAEREVDTTIQ
jgi:hypothetical protein